MNPTETAEAAAERLQKRLIATSTMGVLLLVAALSVADLWVTRGRLLDQGRRRASNLSYVLAEYVDGTFTAMDATLGQLAVHSRRVGGPSAPTVDWAPILAAAKTAAPFMGSVSIADATGRIRHSTTKGIVGQSRREQYIFRQLSTGSSDALAIDTPFLVSAEPVRYVIPLGRRLTRADGSFDGIVVATVIPEEHRRFFRTIETGKRGMIFVFHPDGEVLFREPSTVDPLGESARDHPLLRQAAIAGDRGTIEGPLEPGGPRYLGAFTKLSEPPLVVAVALNQREVLAEWERQVGVTSIGLAALSGTLALTVFVLFRQIDATAGARRALVDLQQAEALKLREANERLASALEIEQRARRDTEAASYIKDQFLMMVSHELRTPLNAIYGWARMLGSGRLSEEQRERALATIERNARAQTRLIDDLLDVSRVISGKLRLDMQQVRPQEVLQAAVDSVRPALAAKGIRLELKLDPRVGVIAADPGRLQQIVWNLLSNAAKFTHDGGEIHLGLERTDGHIDIMVRDNGIGISPEFLPQVFDRFRQQEVGTRRRYGGLGLGLAIVRHLVELHGGTVAADSAGEGQGSTFRVRLPMHSMAPTLRVEAPPASIPLESGARLDGVAVLVVDDELEARELFGSILRDAGATVTTAASAREAMEHLERGEHDVLVSDIEMPNEDGYDLVTRALALANRRGHRLIALAVTAYARMEDKVRALQAGYQWHLAKPVEPVELVSVIASLMGQGVRSG